MAVKKVKKSCKTCEYNFGKVCAGYGTLPDGHSYTYGMPIKEVSKLFPEGCSDYRISFECFSDIMEQLTPSERGMFL